MKSTPHPRGTASERLAGVAMTSRTRHASLVTSNSTAKSGCTRRFHFSLGVESSNDRGSGQSRILSLPIGQELAPWITVQVAVASQGLSPRPLWISAAGKAAEEEYQMQLRSQARNVFLTIRNSTRNQSARSVFQPMMDARGGTARGEGLVVISRRLIEGNQWTATRFHVKL